MHKFSYVEFWNLTRRPFENTFDPDFTFSIPQHTEALARIMYAVDQRKFGAIVSGDFGVGKSLVRDVAVRLLEKREDIRLLLVDNPMGHPDEVIADIMEQVTGRIPTAGSPAIWCRQLKQAITKDRKDATCVLVVDEAHMMDRVTTVEQIRLLLNLQNDEGANLFTILLLGQNKMLDVLARSESLLQRIPVRWRIEPFTPEQTPAYIRHRMKVAGSRGHVFDEDAMAQIHVAGHGLAREINNLCDMVLFVGMHSGAYSIGIDIVNQVLEDWAQYTGEKKDTHAVV